MIRFANIAYSKKKEDEMKSHIVSQLVSEMKRYYKLCCQYLLFQQHSEKCVVKVQIRIFKFHIVAI